MRFMLGLHSVAQKRYCEHEPFIIFSRGAQQRCIPHGQLGGTHLDDEGYDRNLRTYARKGTEHGRL
jgi:hypothetical protein